MHILIGADLVPTESNYELFAAGDARSLLGEPLQEVLAQAQYRIFNLEVPLTDKKTPIKKCGPNLAAPTATVRGYQAIGADIVTLANNHILDQDVQGLESTRRVLEQSGIAYLGAGDTLAEATKPLFITLGEKTIGIYACAEHEFSIVTEHHAGANPFDPLESPDHVKALKEQCDYVIVLYHGGKEHYRYPSPGLQKVCRKLVEKGADLVVCQHSHCIGCEEKYLNGTIVYGQGNFLFDHSTHECWQTSLMIRLDDALQIQYIPLVKKENSVRLAEQMQEDEIMDAWYRRGQEIQSPEVVEAKYRALAEKMLDEYLFGLSGVKRSFVFKVLNRLFNRRMVQWSNARRFTAEGRLAIKNYISCEAHRELLEFGLDCKEV